MEPMRFTTAIKICFVKYADFKGTASRREYWYFTLFLWLAYGCTLILDNTIFGVSVTLNEVWAYGPITSIYFLLIFFPSVAVGTRRLREVGKSGWWQLLYLTVVGIIPLAIWLARPPQEEKPDVDEEYDDLLESIYAADFLKNKDTSLKNISLKEHVFALLISFYSYFWFELTWLLSDEIPYLEQFIFNSVFYGAFSVAAAFIFTTCIYILTKKDISRVVFYWLIFFSIFHVAEFAFGVEELIDALNNDFGVSMACQMAKDEKAGAFFSFFAGISVSDVRDACEAQKSLPLLVVFSIVYNLAILFIFKYLNRKFPVISFKPREGSVADEN